MQPLTALFLNNNNYEAHEEPDDPNLPLYSISMEEAELYYGDDEEVEESS